MTFTSLFVSTRSQTAELAASLRTAACRQHSYLECVHVLIHRQPHAHRLKEERSRKSVVCRIIICNFRSRNNLPPAANYHRRTTDAPKNPLPRKTDFGPGKDGRKRETGIINGTDRHHPHPNPQGWKWKRGVGRGQISCPTQCHEIWVSSGGWLASTNLAPDPTRTQSISCIPARRRPWKGGRKKSQDGGHDRVVLGPGRPGPALPPHTASRPTPNQSRRRTCVHSCSDSTSTWRACVSSTAWNRGRGKGKITSKVDGSLSATAEPEDGRVKKEEKGEGGRFDASSG